MITPDGRQYDSSEPAFFSVEDFLSCTELIGHSGALTPCCHKHLGIFAPTVRQTEITDILLADEPDFTICLPSLEFDVFRIVDIPIDRYSGSSVYFTLVVGRDCTPTRWELLGKYGTDASNLTLTDHSTRTAIKTAIHGDDDIWNTLADAVCGYSDIHYSRLLDLGFDFATPDSPGSTFCIPSSKFATLHLGYDESRIVALQGRWL